MPIFAEEPDTCIHISEVVVTGLTGNAKISEMPAPVSVITSGELATHSSTNIIDAISREPGIAQITTGSGISKPVIRGLGYNRVLVVNDGIRQEGQQWGDEHGIEVDAANINSVEILKGPASLMYGSDAMAGVIIFHDAPIMPLGRIGGSAQTEYQTNNGLFNYSLNFAGNKKGFIWNWRYSDKMTHDYKNAYDGYVTNSRFRERAVSGVLGYSGIFGISRLKLSYYHLTPGMTEGERDETTGELLHSDDGKHYGVGVPYQQIHHYKAVWDNSIQLGRGELKAIFGYQQNRRQEFEEANKCGLDFILHTMNYDVRYVAPTLSGWKTNIGIGGMYQRSLNNGSEYLIPAYHLFDIGTFATAGHTFGPIYLTGGLRYDHRNLHSEQLADRFTSFSRSFSGLTGSIGAVYHINNDIDMKLNVSRGFRAPNMSELASNGEHEGTFRYEIGNNNLKPEYSWQADWGMDYTSTFFSAAISLFANRIENYIYAEKEEGITVDNTPVYKFTSGDARILGGEAKFIIHPIDHLHLENTFSYVNSVQLNQPHDSKYLPMTPAPRWLATAHYDIKGHNRSISGMYAEIEMDCNLRQNHYYAANNTETATPSYTLFNASVGTDIISKGKQIATISLAINNVFDRAYQNHLSRLKYAEINNVTGRQGVFNMGRNIGIKVKIPIG